MKMYRGFQEAYNCGPTWQGSQLSVVLVIGTVLTLYEKLGAEIKQKLRNSYEAQAG